MATIGVSITKSCPWRGGVAEFSNVYHYNRATPPESGAEAQAIINAVRELERPVHAVEVKFLRAKIWGPTGVGAGASLMIDDAVWTGIAGLAASTTGFYKELAYLIQWPLGRYGSRNRRQYLRKWLHTCSSLGATVGQQDGSSVITPVPTALATYITSAASLTVTGSTESPLELVSESGKLPVSPGSMYPFLEHHQFGR